MSETAASADQVAEAAALHDSYLRDTPYTWNFFSSQSPVVLRNTAYIRGLSGKPLDEAFAYCELGCGNGVTANLLAAANPQGRFVAVDFNPEHIANGRRLAEAGGLDNIEFIEADFAALLNRDGLPAFDYITMHGVYSWVTPDVRQTIRDFVAARLAPQGLVHVSYNAMPGWAPLLPLREIMLRYAETAKKGSLDKAVKGLQYLRFLRERNAAFFRATPAARRFLDDLLESDPAYVAHEYFNEGWEPLYFSDVARAFDAEGMAYVGSTRVERNYTDLIVPEPFWSLLESAENELVKETHKSLILNEMFRRDIYCPKPAREAAGRDPALLDNAVFGSVRPPEQIKRTIRFGPHEIRLSDAIYDSLIPAAAPGRLTVKDLEGHADLAGHKPAAIRAGLQRLVATGQFRLFTRPSLEIGDDAAANFRIASGYNRAFLEERLFVEPQIHLASPVLGSGMAVDMMQATLLLAGDKAGGDGMVDAAVERLAAQPKGFRIGGRQIEGTEALRPVVEEQARAFGDTWLPLLMRFGIAEPA